MTDLSQLTDAQLEDLIARAVAKARPPEGSGSFLNTTAGINESIAGTLGAPVDIVNSALGLIGLDSQRPIGGSASIKDLMGAVGVDPRDVRPGTSTERALRGAARGITDAASVIVPAGLLAQGAKAGTMTQGVAKALAAQPGVQIAAGGIGGFTGGAANSDAVGLATALAVPSIAGGLTRTITPIRSQLSPEEQRLAGIAAREGIQLTAGQRSGSRPLRTLEAVFDELPLTASPAKAQQQRQAAQFNKAVLSRAGIQADAATPDVLARAQARLSSEFERLTAGTRVNLDNDFLNDLSGVASRYGAKLPSQQKAVFEAYVDDLLGTGGAVAGDTYQVTRSDLTRQAKAFVDSDPAFSNALRGLRDALDGAAGRSIPPGMKGQWDEARRQYANLKAINKAMSNSTAAATGGDISPTQLSAAVRQSMGGKFAQGGGELNDLARVGTAFLRSTTPNSGTAQRTLMQNLLTGGPIGAGGTALAMGADPVGTVAATGAALLGPRAAQVAYNSPAVQAYLGNRVAAGLAPDVNAGLLGAIVAAQGRGLLYGDGP